MPTHPIATSLIPMDQIRPNPNQPRKYFDPQAIADLKESLTQRGLINPISVRQVSEGAEGAEGAEGVCPPSPSGPHAPTALYEIIAGERRYRAARDLGWAQIDCRIWPPETTPAEVEMLSLVENLHRTDLTPFEIANGYRVLTQPPYSMTHEEVADQCGQGRSTVSQFLMIGSLDAKVLDSVKRLTNLGFGHLLQICRLKTPEDQLKVAKMASDGDWTVKKLATEVDKLASPPSPLPNGEGRDSRGEAQAADLIWKGDTIIISRPFKPGQETAQSYIAWLTQALPAFQETKPGKMTGPTEKITASAGTEQKSTDEAKPTGAPRFPQTPAEQAELEAISAQSSGPGPVYAWLFSAGGPMVETVRNLTWADFKVKDGQEGLPKILEALKKFWLKEAQV